MSKPDHAEPEMRSHYDFSGGVRSKYARRYAEGTNVVVLDPDVVAAAFRTPEAVNAALRERMHGQETSRKPGT